MSSRQQVFSSRKVAYCLFFSFQENRVINFCSSLSSFEEISTPGQTQTGLVPRVYSFTTPDCCTAWISCLLSQHQVSSSKTVRPRAPCGTRCIGHAVRTWCAVCSEAPHSQFGEGTRPHLCMDEWNRPTPVRMRLSLTQATRCKPIPTGLAPVSGTKARSLKAFSQYSVSHL